MRWFTSIVAALTDAWQELRVHRMRVALSLIGIGIAVASITFVAGFGSATQSFATTANDRFGGRPATLTVQVAGDAAGDRVQAADEAFSTILHRYGISYGSRIGEGQVSAQFVDGVAPVRVTAVDQAYGEMRRVPVTEGSWFAPGDADRLAPAVVISKRAWERLGSPPLATHPTIDLLTPDVRRAVVVGVYDEGLFSTGGQAAYMLFDDFSSLREIAGTAGSSFPQYSVWLPTDQGEEFKSILARDFRASMGTGYTVTVQRTDYLASGTDPFAGMAVFIGAVSSIVLAIGAVGYINLGVVTVRQRIREIGIRRSFGATAARVFLTVLLESFVGTLVAGVAGVAVAALILQNLDLGLMFGGTPSGERAPFPLDAALFGLFVSAFVGFVSGLIPATIATRVRLVEAMRSS